MITFDNLLFARDVRSKRISSWDRSGKNDDYMPIKQGETKEIARISGSGCIRHLWFTVNCTDRYYLRKVVIRIFWDKELHPSVEVPIGDFFGVGHGVANHYVSLPFSMITNQHGPQKNAAMNCFLPMPFSDGARFEIVNESNSDIDALYYYIDYEEQQSLPDKTLRFHSCWHRIINHTDPLNPHTEWRKLANLSADRNFIILETEGEGHYIGCNMSIDHINPAKDFPWFGEGDDMIFIDDETWPPTMHGTGTEDYFCAAWGFPSGKYDGLFHGISLACPVNGLLTQDPWSSESGCEPDLWYSGKWTFYRFHILDPITFKKKIKVTIEQGHANCQRSDVASTAYWYQSEPHIPFEHLPAVEHRIPLLTKESLSLFVKTI